MKKYYSIKIIEHAAPGLDFVIVREKTSNVVTIEWLPHEETKPHLGKKK